MALLSAPLDFLDLLPQPPPHDGADDAAHLPALEPGGAGDRLERARALLTAGRSWIRARHDAGASGLSVCRLLTELMDRLVIGLWRELVEEARLPRDLALVALGGYGRREQSPHSDVDLLLLRGRRAPESKVAPIARAFLNLLWDLKLQVGWSIRSPDQCARAASADHTVLTALLDRRLHTGDEALFERLDGAVMRDLLTQRADAFVSAKVEEMRARRERYGESVFVLEPNLKLGEGGLRDLETALWIAQARFRARGLDGLLMQSVLPPSDVRALRSARDFLLRTRNHLHFLTRRKEDRLTFDLQEMVAPFLGFEAQEDLLPVEQFMRRYYIAARAIRRAADGLVSRCEEATRPTARVPARRIGHFKVFQGKLTLDAPPELLRREPWWILRAFHLADEEGLPLYSWLQDQIRQALPQLAEARSDDRVREAFLELFSRPGSRGQFLFEMHELGALGAVMPEFGRITAHHQHDLYHVYTVDVHSLFATRRLYGLRAGEAVEEVPELSREMHELEDPLPLYLGMLLHDAGKGMGGNHSEKGRVLMVQLGERLRLTPRQREIAEFLVLHHLLMSSTSQRRDISDPELVARFAQTCGDVEKLVCLYLLTWADIASVGPGMWTEWKARLLAELFHRARARLLGEPHDVAGQLATARRVFEDRWARMWGAARAARLSEVLPERYFLAADVESATLHASLLERVARHGFAAALRRRTGGAYSELTLAAPDRSGLLALFAGVLSAHRIDVHRARIISTTDGRALDVFDVAGPRAGPLERSRWRNARADLLKVLRGEATVDEVLRRRRPNALFERPMPRVMTGVTVDNRASERFSVVDVRAEDRVGLLYVLASALREAGAAIALAKIATEGNCAID
ncbi:MAG TPA: [protein-PII] uridylyltransferase, partial [Myxococcaceae bacterium]|nr:[protein-PII] uridylyltransferase [Myxococcaceae bacterium]